MTTHTPGPWATIGKQGTAIWADSEIIAQMSRPRTHHKTARANALLIAAAPELLEVALLCRHLCIEGNALQRSVDAAIAKATGESE